MKNSNKDKTILYTFLPELQLGIEVFYGKINYTDLIAFKEKVKEKQINDMNFNPNFKGLSVIENAFFDISEEEIEDFKDYYKKNKNFLSVRKTAILTQTPKQVVLASLYSEVDKDIPMNFYVFSTLKASLKWLGIPLKYEFKIIEIIKNATQQCV